MSRALGDRVPSEMLALWLLELALSFCLAYTLLATGYGPALHAPSANHALVLALTAGLTAVAAGLYRHEVFARTRSMLVNTALGGVMAFPAAWGVSWLFGLDADRLLGTDALWPLKVVATWVAALFATRLLFLAAVRSNLFARRVAVLGSVPDTVAAVRAGRRGFIEISDVMGGAIVSPEALRRAGIRDAVASRAAHAALSTDALTDDGAPASQWEPSSSSGNGASSGSTSRSWTQLGSRPWTRSGPAACSPRSTGLATSASASRCCVFTLPLMLAGGAAGAAGQRGSGVLPAGAGGAGRQAVHAVEVPQHEAAMRRRGARPGRSSAIRG